MEPRQLLENLLKRRKLNPTSLAAKLKRLDEKTKATQPQIYKFLKGTAQEPRRETLRPVAEFFSIPVEAFYDADVAEHVALSRGLIGDALAPSEEAPGQMAMVGLSPEDQQLLRDLKDIASSRASKFRDAIHQAAEEAREIRADEARRTEREPEKATSHAARGSSASRSSTSIHYGDGNRRQLPLTVVPDPFTAEPGEREATFYERLERAPKADAGKSRRPTKEKK